MYEIYIRTTPEKLWTALTDADQTQQYFFGTRVASSWKSGAQLTYTDPKGGLMVDGKVVEADPPRRLVTTWRAAYSPEVAGERPSRVTWTIEPVGAVCKLSVVHDDFEAQGATWKSTASGWPVVLSGLKTYLETGEALPMPAM